MASNEIYNCPIVKDGLRAYVLAGKAIFTLYSKKTDLRYTFCIKRAKGEKWYQIQRLYAEDNTKDYKVLGVFSFDESHNLLLKFNHYGSAESQIKYFLKVLWGPYSWPDTMYCYPSKRCARCGRLLTTPESVMTGLGPKCKGRCDE